MPSKNNQRILLDAIEYYPKISDSQKYLLKILVNSDIALNTRGIIKITQSKKQWVYFNLKKLRELGLLHKDKERDSTLSISEDIVKKLVDFYNTSQSRKKKAAVNPMNNFKKNISTYLQEMNVSISAFEKQAGLGSAALNRILDGKTKNPATHTLIKIANTMGYSLDELFDQKLLNSPSSSSEKKHST